MRAIRVASVFMSVACAVQAQSQADLKKRLDLLEERVAKLEAAAGKPEAAESGDATKEERVAAERAKAKALIKELKEQYPNAINHRGNLLADILAKGAE